MLLSVDARYRPQSCKHTVPTFFFCFLHLSVLNLSSSLKQKTMKLKIIHLLLGVYSFTASFAQTDSLKSNMQNHKYKWGCSVAINSVEAQIVNPVQSILGSSLNPPADKTEKSFSLSIVPKYSISDDILLRFELGITNIQFKYSQELTNSFYHSINNSDLNQKIYRFIPGLQWNFFKKKYIEVYCGAIVSYNLYNELEFNDSGENSQMPIDTLLSWFISKTVLPGGFALGIGAFTGFNIKLNKYVSLGAEVSSTLSYYKIGGDYSTERTYQNLPSPPVTEVSGTSSDTYKGCQFSRILSSFNISLWF